MPEYTKQCRWCKEDFQTTIPNKLYCCDDHLREAHLEDKREWIRRYRRKKQLGSVQISSHRNPNFEIERRIVHKEYQKTFSTYYSKGEQAPHNGSGASLLESFSITFIMESCGPCPNCGEDIRLKDLSRAEVTCRLCGFTIYGPPHPNIKYPDTYARMATTNLDVIYSENTRDPKTNKKELSVQDIAWNRFRNIL